MYEVLSGKQFFGEMKFWWQIEEAVLRGERPAIPESVRLLGGLFSLLQRAWADEPDERPTFEEVHRRMLDAQCGIIGVQQGNSAGTGCNPLGACCARCSAILQCKCSAPSTNISPSSSSSSSSFGTLAAYAGKSSAGGSEGGSDLERELARQITVLKEQLAEVKMQLQIAQRQQGREEK